MDSTSITNQMKRYILSDKKIRDTGIDYVCTGHCTEKHAYEILKEELGDRLEKMMVGLKKEF